MPDDSTQKASRIVEGVASNFKEQFGLKEEQLKVVLAKSETGKASQVLSAESLQKLLSLLLVLPHGVAKMSHAVAGK